MCLQHNGLKQEPGDCVHIPGYGLRRIVREFGEQLVLLSTVGELSREEMFIRQRYHGMERWYLKT